MSTITKSKFKTSWEEDELVIKNLRITDSKVLDFMQEADEKDYEYIITRAIEKAVKITNEIFISKVLISLKTE